MAYELRDMSGSLFDNDRKTTDNQPDYKGSCMVAGIEYWVSGWEKTSGSKGWTSLAFTVKEAKPEPKPEPTLEPKKPAPKKTGGKFDDMEDDIPF